MKRLLLATLIAGFACAASAQGVAVSVAADVDADATAAQDSVQQDSVQQVSVAPATTPDELRPTDRLSDRLCLRSTGTRIINRRDTRNAQRCVAANGRVYSRDDLRDTGRVDMADALRALDPSIH